MTGIYGRFFVDRGDFTLDVDLQLPATGVTALFGRSGSGKTTTLRCLAGLERLRHGRMQLNGETWQDEQSFVPPHRRPLGYVFQEASLFPHLSVEHNLLYGWRRTPAEHRQIEFDEVTRLLGLAPLLQRPPAALSGGQRQRVAIGRALLTSPRLLLMDEPLASLDSATKEELLPYFERLHSTLAIPVIYVTHALEEVARIADHMVLLEEGRVRAEGPLQEMLTRTDLPLAHGDTAATILYATVTRHHPEHHLTELDSGCAPLFTRQREIAVGEEVRVQIRAREVTLARSRPRDLTALNCLPARILELNPDPHPSHLLVRLDTGGQPLLARITRRA
ncbi:MAG: molybdenum ABC transporter ATP-binding protein, partial [Halorhodospira sp.]